MTRFGAIAIGLIAIAVVAVLAFGGDEEQTAASPSLDSAKSMSTAELVGQRIVTGYVGTTPPRSVLRAAKLGHIGGVILFTNNMPRPRTARRAIAKLQAAAKQGGQPPLFTMIDQEGGIVQRLPTLPPTKSPEQIGSSQDPAATGKIQGRSTGRALRKYGFNVNLAPVVDVPQVSNSFLGNRAYSSDPAIVANAGCAFAGGLEASGTAATFKHFPGLGRAGADTDFEDVRINVSLAQLRTDWAAHTQCPDTPSFTMMSSARYPDAGITVPASLTKTTYELLTSTGFDGLTITDAMETPQYNGQPNAPRRALKAGVDVVLYGQAFSRATRTYKRLLADARAGRFKRETLIADAAQLLELKSRVAAR